MGTVTASDSKKTTWKPSFFGVNTMENRKVQQRIRIYDESLWQYIDKLERAESFDGNFNEVINQALKIGLPRLYELTFNSKEYYKKIRDEEGETEVSRRLRDLSVTVDEVSVQVGIIKYLTSILFNVEGHKLEGKALTTDMLESGIFATLPKTLQEIENTMIESTRKSRSNKK